MKVSLTEISKIKKQISVEVPPDVVEVHLDAAYQKIGQKAKLKGFRPGKVPRSVLEQNFREDAESEAVRHAVSESYPQALNELDLNPIAPPEIAVTSFGRSQPLTYQATFEVRPVIDVDGYKGMSLTKEKAEVQESEVLDNLKVLRERMMQLIPVTEGRGAQAGDFVVIDYQGLLGDKPAANYRGQDYVVELGKGYVFKELDEGIAGMKGGETKRLDVLLPAEWTDKEMAGKQITFEVSLKEIKEKKLPDLTDDFAKDVGNFSSLEDLKTKIREDVVRTKEQQAKNGLRQQIVERLIEKNEFEVPESLLQGELEGMLKRLEGQLKGQGVTLEQAGVTQGDFFAKNRDAAVLQVKGALLFDAVAQKENISVSPEEVDKHIEEMALMAGQSGATWKKYYQEKNMMGQIAWSVREEKSLDFVLSQSKIKVRE